MPRSLILSPFLGLFILSSCGGGDPPTGTPGDNPPSHSSVAISSSLSPSASAAATARHSFGLGADRVRVLITSNLGTPLRDTTIAVADAGQEQHFIFDVAGTPGTTVSVSTSYSSNAVALYGGTASVNTYDATRPPTSIPTATIAVTPTAPGGSAKKVTLTGS